MDFYQLNKIAGAVLGTLLFIMVVYLASNAIFSHHEPEKPGYNLPSAEPPASQAKAPTAASEDVAKLLATADPKKGEDYAKACQLCHNLGKGEGVKIGPPLYGVVGRPKGSIAGFDYSPGMKAKGGNWTFEDLFTFINNPQAFVSGTKMTFPGEPDPKKRADIIAYLDTLSDNPVPLPKAGAAAPAANPPAPAATTAPAKAPPSPNSSVPATNAGAPAANPPSPAPSPTPPATAPAPSPAPANPPPASNAPAPKQ